MAMKPVHYSVLAVVGCALFAVVTLPSAPVARSFLYGYRLDPLVRERIRLREEASAAIANWRSVVLRDSLKAIARADDHSRGRGAPQLSFNNKAPHNLRSMSERLITREWNAIGIDSARVPLVTIVVGRDEDYDSASVWNREGFFYLVPQADAHESDACITVATVSIVRHKALATAAGSMAYGLGGGDLRPAISVTGACAFYAAFGRPGPEIERWLSRRGYEPALSARWDLPRESPVEGKMAGGHLLAGFLRETDLYSISHDARRCLLGDEAVCAAVMLAPLPSGSGLSEGIYRGTYGTRSTFQEAAVSYLADMRREFGPDKFEKFWTSKLEPAAAFEQATGESIGTWTHRWAKRTNPGTVAGAKIPATFFGWGLVIAVGCVSAAAVAAKRRTVR